MKKVNASEMRTVNGGLYYWCTKCKKVSGYTWVANGLHVIRVHNGNPNNEKFVIKY